MNQKPIIVIGALFGSASFITQLIIGSIFALKSFRIEVLPFLRDVLFYLILIIWIFYIFMIKKQIEKFDSFGFLSNQLKVILKLKNFLVFFSFLLLFLQFFMEFSF